MGREGHGVEFLQRGAVVLEHFGKGGHAGAGDADGHFDESGWGSC